MSSKRLRRISIDQCFKDRLSYHNFITCKDILSKSAFELVRQLGLGHLSAKKLVLQVSKACAPTPTTALDLWKDHQHRTLFLATSLAKLDLVLHGGLPLSTITEVAGPSGCGKTQFSMMLSVLATLPHGAGGLDGGVVYIDTESAFSAERLVEMAEAKFPHHFSTEQDLITLTEKVHIMAESSCRSLLNRLENLEEFLIGHNIKLIVVDSVASLVRKEFDSRSGKNMTARTNLLSRQAAILKKLAEDFCVPVLVTNQITTRYGTHTTETSIPESEEETTQEVDSGYVTAALGNTWSHCVNTRLILQYLDGPYRQVLVAKSPVAPFANFVYKIQAEGLVLQEDGAGHYDGTDPGLQKIRVRSSITQDAFLY